MPWKQIIPDYSAGRELDALVAEKVMGLTVTPVTVIDGQGVHSDIGTVGTQYEMKDGRTGVPARAIPLYSTDIAAAWSVVEVVIKDTLVFLNCIGALDGDDKKRQFICVIHQPEPFIGDMEGMGETMPLAICLAALKWADSVSNARG